MFLHLNPKTQIMSSIPNVLAGRYASDSMKAIWSAEGRIVLEPEFWIAVKKAQKDLERTKAYSRKHEAQAKANAEKAKAFDAAQTKARTVEERLAALERETADLRAARDRSALVESVAKSTGLDASIVGALNGADEDALTEQANAVKAAMGSGRRYPAVCDQGTGTGSGTALTEEQISKIKNPAERVRARARAIHDKK